MATTTFGPVSAFVTIGLSCWKVFGKYYQWFPSNPCWLQTSYSLCICHNRCQLQQSNRPVSVAVLFAYTRVVVIMSVCLSVKLSVCLSLSLSRHHPISQVLSHDLQFADPNSAVVVIIQSQ